MLDITDLAQTTDGDTDRVGAFRGELGHTNGVGNRTGGNAVGADAEGTPLVSPDEGQGINTSLGSTGMGLEDLTVIGQSGGDVDNGPLGSLEVREADLCGVKGSDEIDLDNGAEGVEGEVLGERKEVSGGAVDKDVEAAVVGHVLVDCDLNLLMVADVGGDGQEFSSGRGAHLLGCCLQLGEAMLCGRNENNGG